MPRRPRRPNRSRPLMEKHATGTAGAAIRTGMWGLLVGGAMGFSLGLLLAPEEGRKMRLRLVYQLERLALRTSDLAERLLAPSEESEARRTGDALVQDARAEAKRIREEIDALLDEIRHQDSSS